jgi:hypothetical protein
MRLVIVQRFDGASPWFLTCLLDDSEAFLRRYNAVSNLRAVTVESAREDYGCKVPPC